MTFCCLNGLRGSQLAELLEHSVQLAHKHTAEERILASLQPIKQELRNESRGNLFRGSKRLSSTTGDLTYLRRDRPAWS